MTPSMTSAIRRFLRAEQGGLSVETVIIFPLLLWAYAAMFIYWDAYKAQNVNLKATYTIADMISREDVPITPDYVDGSNDAYKYLIRSNDGNDARVSIVEFNTSDPADPNAAAVMRLRWSYATGSALPHNDLSVLQPKLPMLPIGAELIVVETNMTWTPPFHFALLPTGLDQRDMSNFVFTSPRFVASIRFDMDMDGTPDDVVGDNTAPPLVGNHDSVNGTSGGTPPTPSS